jgi:phosphate transport system substrate-binding protein
MKANQKIVKRLGADDRAISPIVATLMLVLVAAGAAVGFGVFMNGFQKNTQSKVTSDAPTETLHIGGSSTVFELTEKALPTWKQLHSSIAIDDQEGGSGAGQIAVCQGKVDLGASSKPVPATGNPSLATCPQDATGTKIPGQSLQEFVVGYDGVAIAWNAASASSHCTAMSFTSDNLRELYGVNGAGKARGTDGTALVAGGSGSYTWGDLQSAGICTGTAGAAATVQLLQRSDNSGTTDGFCNKVLAYTKDGVHCTNDASDQLVSTYYTQTVGQQGNDGLATYLDSHPDALSYIGFGTVATDSNLKAAAIGGVTPTVSTIKAAGADKTTLAKDKACNPTVSGYTVPAGEYCAVRPLEYITAGTPTANEQLFLDFMLQTLNNVNFNKAAGYVSIYS